MGKQIKAEWFRIMHSGNNFWAFSLVSLIACFYPFSGRWEVLDESLSACLALFLKSAYIMFFLIVLVVVALFVNRYQNRTYYYEIMNGTNIHNVIFSKLVAYGFYVELVFMIPNLILYTIVATRNGLGGYENIGMLLFLFNVILLRVVVEAVLLTMIFRRMVPSLAVWFFCFISSLMAIIIVDSLDEGKMMMLRWVTGCCPVQQVMRLYEPIAYTGGFIGVVIGSFLVEAIVLYGFTWWNYKRKNFR